MRARRDELGELGEEIVQRVRRAAVDGARRLLSTWQDPRARALRQRRRALRALRLRGWAAGLGGGATAVMAVSSAPVELVASGGVATTMLAALAVSAGLRFRRLNREPLPEPTVRPQLPPSGSAAYEPLRRLSAAEDSLAQVLRQLSAPLNGVPPVPPESVAEIRTSATQAATALRAVGERLRAVELARDAAPPLERGPLVEDIRRLRAQLDAGVEDFGRLVAAAGRVVAATSGATPRAALQDSIDRLAGLALALRELERGTTETA
ncbi:MAG TPA: hypothetical protein VIL00_18380 [Pseudonocardiaceae bacterium]